MLGGTVLSGGRTDVPNTKRRQIRIAVEGNIASGKSSFLEYLSNQKNTEVLYEPLKEWQTLEGGNLIARMYEDPHRWGYLMQSYVLLTMLKLHHTPQRLPIAIMERSVFSARHCFVENLYKNCVIDDAEYNSYCQWYDYLMTTQRPHLDLIDEESERRLWLFQHYLYSIPPLPEVYLRTSPEVCMQRIQQRGRQEEKPVTVGYLRTLHDRYEEWLGGKENCSEYGDIPVLVIDADKDCAKDKDLFKTFSLQMMNFPKVFHGLAH